MSETLSKALQKYYSRKGNRIIFSNGMTLNQLALEMWERLGYSQIDPSVISRVLKGERLFTVQQIGVFCRVLKLSLSEEELLRDSLIFELSQKFGLGNFFLNKKTKFLIDLVRDNIKKAHEARAMGVSNLASEWIENINSLIIREYAKNKSQHSVCNELLKLQAEALLEQAYCYFEIAPNDYAYRKTLFIANKLKWIAERIHKPLYNGFAHFITGSGFYINGMYKPALKHLRKSLEYNLPEPQQLHCFREMALCLAYLKESDEYEIVKTQLVRKQASISNDYKTEILECMARSEGLLDYSSTEATLDTAWKSYFEINKPTISYSPKAIRKVQLIRTELEIAQKLKIGNKNYLEKIGKEGINIASKHNYVRHKEKIVKYLNKILN